MVTFYIVGLTLVAELYLFLVDYLIRRYRAVEPRKGALLPDIYVWDYLVLALLSAMMIYTINR